MNIIYDDDNTIAQFKTFEYLSTVLDSAIQNNGEGEVIFSRAGISSLIVQYQKMITPYSYNGQWQNANVQYNPKKVFIEVFPKLDEKHRFLFVRAIVEYANFLNFDKEILANHLALLGYSIKDSDESRSKYTIFQTSKGVVERTADLDLLEKKLRNDYPNIYYLYNEALSTFGNGEYKSCIDNCRTLYEKITQALTGATTDKAALIIANETVIDENGNVITSKDRIYKYWLNKKKGANRYRYFTTLYSIMSGLGTHGEEAPSRADAVLILRAFEDVLIWMLKI